MEIPENEMDDDKLAEINERLEEQMKKDGIDERDILSQAHDNLNSWSAAFNDNSVRAKQEKRFALGEQWESMEKAQMQALHKPALVFNKIYDPVKKIIGEERKNKPNLMVRDLGGRASQEQITLRQNVLMSLAYDSQNDLVYQQAFQDSLLGGYGAFEVYWDYMNPREFRKTIRYGLVRDVTQTSFDPQADMPHKGDGNFAAINYFYSKEEFHAMYPWVKNPVSYPNNLFEQDFHWGNKDGIVVSKQYMKHWFPITLHKLSNDMVVTEEEWQDLQKEYKLQKELAQDAIVVKGMIMNEIPYITESRYSKDYFIRQYFLTQNKIIKYADWPSKHMGLIFVDGDSHYIDGLQRTRSFVHDARDPQKFLNYVGSEVAAEIKNRRREQWIGTPDNVKNDKNGVWKNPEIQQGILLADVDLQTGKLPQRMPPSEVPQSLLVHYQRAGQDIKEIMGFSEQEQLLGRDVSGKARRERKLEGAMSSYIYRDNLNQAIEQGGRVVMDLLPYVVGDDAYPMLVTKPDGKSEPIILNERKGEEIVNKLQEGNYDVEIDAGPSFAVQKEIALEFLQETTKNDPQIFSLIADLWARNLDVQFMPQMAERFKTLVPPEIIAKEEGKEPPPPQPNPAMEMQQLQMQNERQKLVERAEELQIRKSQHRIDIAEMLMKAREMEQKMTEEQRRGNIELTKAELDHRAKLAKVVADLQKMQHSEWE